MLSEQGHAPDKIKDGLFTKPVTIFTSMIGIFIYGSIVIALTTRSVWRTGAVILITYYYSHTTMQNDSDLYPLQRHVVYRCPHESRTSKLAEASTAPYTFDGHIQMPPTAAQTTAVKRNQRTPQYSPLWLIMMVLIWWERALPPATPQLPATVIISITTAII